MVVAGIDPDPAKAGARALGRGLLGGDPSVRRGGGYVNFLMADEGRRGCGRPTGRTIHGWPGSRPSVTGNLFRVNQNILPAG